MTIGITSTGGIAVKAIIDQRCRQIADLVARCYAGPQFEVLARQKCFIVTAEFVPDDVTPEHHRRMDESIVKLQLKPNCFIGDCSLPSRTVRYATSLIQNPRLCAEQRNFRISAHEFNLYPQPFRM